MDFFASRFGLAVHNPIDQKRPFEVSNNNGDVKCIRCQSHHQVHTNGNIDTPPISIQFGDMSVGIRRNWKATRYYCNSCGYLFDVVENWM